MVIKQMEWRPQAAAKRAAPVGARFIARLVTVEVRFANGLRGAINLAPTERATRFAVAHDDRSLFPVYFVDLHSTAPTERAASPKDDEGVH